MASNAFGALLTYLGASKSKFFPHVDQTAQEIRALVTPVRDDWVEGKPYKTNTLSLVLGK
jgi:hypothetical protein